MKSAMQSANTIIFIPSSLDFIRVHNHFRKSGASFAVLSESVLSCAYCCRRLTSCLGILRIKTYPERDKPSSQGKKPSCLLANDSIFSGGESRHVICAGAQNRLNAERILGTNCGESAILSSTVLQTILSSTPSYSPTHSWMTVLMCLT